MKLLPVLIVLLLASCAQHKSAPQKTNLMAYDEMAFGNIKASAVRDFQKDHVCFDISLMMKNVEQTEAMASNWTVAWIDKDSRYHLMSLNQRDPASVPKGNKDQWNNSFRTCAPKAALAGVTSLILTPKELSYKETEGMKLQWE